MWGASYKTIRKFKPKSSWGSSHDLQKAAKAANRLSDQKEYFLSWRRWSPLVILISSKNGHGAENCT
jgi:hypothetical protein